MGYYRLILAALSLLISSPAFAGSTPPNCPTSGGSQALNYLTATNAFSCNTVQTGLDILGTSASATAPRISGDATTGFYTAGPAKVDVAISGVNQGEFSSSGLALSTPLAVSSGGTGLNTASAINLREQGACGITNATTIINAALAAAKAAGKAVYAPGCTYNHSGVILVDSVVLFGDGVASNFVSTDTTSPSPQMAIKLTGTAPALMNVGTTTTWAGSRQQNSAGAAVWTTSATNFRILNNTIVGSADAGIITDTSSNGLIQGNSVSGTLADGIHTTGASSAIRIIGNRTDTTGDDGIAVVSYLSDSAITKKISIIGNNVYGSSTRGISVVGGSLVSIVGNTIDNTTLSNIYINSELSFNTYDVSDIVVDSNVENSGGSPSGTILASNFIGGRSGYVTHDVTFSNNIGNNLKLHGVQVGSGTAVYVQNAKIVHNTLNGNGNSNSGQGVFISGAQDVTVEDNTFYNFGSYGVFATASINSGFVKVLSDHINQVNTGAQAFVDGINLNNAGFTFINVSNNTQTNGSTTIQRLVELGASDTNSIIANNIGDNTTISAPGTFNMNSGGTALHIGGTGTAQISYFNGTVGIGTTAPDKTLTVSASGIFDWLGRSTVQSPSDGVIEISNNAVTDFSLLTFGGTTSSFPAIKRSSAAFSFRLADDSADTSVTASSFNASAGATGYQLNGVNGISYPSVDSTSNATVIIGSGAWANPSTSAAYSSVVIGYQAMGTGTMTTAALKNTVVGYQAGKALTSGNGAAFFGYQAGLNNSSGSSNAFFGNSSGLNVTTGGTNTAVGNAAMAGDSAITASDNVAIGTSSLRHASGTISGIVSVGSNSLSATSFTAGNITAIGYQTGKLITTGGNNTIIGYQVASTTLTSGTNNILIGNSSAIDTAANNTSNTLNIGGSGGSWVLVTGTNTNTTASTIAHGVWNMPDLASSSAATTGTVCWTTSTGLLNVDTTTTCLLSLEELKDKHGKITGALEIVSKLEPFWFTWKKTTPEWAGDKYMQPGLGAHQVESVDKRLVAYGTDGKLKGVRYQEMTAVLTSAVKELNQKVDKLAVSGDANIIAANDNVCSHFNWFARIITGCH